jgi:ubiquinone/menaquinone biosynthesis C-methylase UbiE/DNA-binding transcriptional ArsR family regulator
MKTAPVIPLLDLLAALSDATRLRLLRVLDVHELSVGELAKALQLPQSTVSRHLKVLSDAGWVVRRSEGTAGLFSMVPDELTSEARNVWQSVRAKATDAEESHEDDVRVRAVLAERRTDSLSFFGRNSDQWDAMRAELFGPRFTGLALLGLLPRTSRIADFGAGTGIATQALATFVAHVDAIEQSEAMLAVARERLSSTSVAPRVTFHQAPVESTPLASASVDAAIAVLVLHHLDDPAEALREMSRVTAPGGTILIVDMVAHNREDYKRTMGHKHLGFGVDEVRSMMHAAGLADVMYVELPAEPMAKGPGVFVAMGIRRSDGVTE